MTTANDIAQKIAKEHGLTRDQAKDIVTSVFKHVETAVTEGAEAAISGFGKFKVKSLPEREARNPATGAKITVAATRKLTFTPAKAVKDAINS